MVSGVIDAREPLAGTALLSAKEVAAFSAAGFSTVADLLDHLPRRHEDRRAFDSFPNQPSPQAVCLRGTVVDTFVRRMGAGRRMDEAVVMDGEGGVFGSSKITCRWFNMPFMQKMIAAGQEVVVYGKVKESGGRLVMDHPEFELLRGDDLSSIHMERIVPVYKNIAGIGQRRLREIVHLLLDRVDSGSLSAPYEICPGFSRMETIADIHFPDSLEKAAEARRRLAFEEFFEIQLRVLWSRVRHHELEGRVLGKRTALLKRFYESLPFDLTEAQKRSIREIVADMRLPRPMNRLLQGDVGSGKTFVAIAALLLAVDSGCQAALMAPTQILAEQHYLVLCKWMKELGVRVALRTGSREDRNHLEMEGLPQILVGTHALMYDDDRINDLGLVVIDEQHKFGVGQRAALIGRGVRPDVLVMTATPIPRTLTMTVYGDLDVSLLDEKPAGRGKVVTAVRTGAKQKEVNAFVKRELEAGRQAYLVYPLVEESGSLKAESATEAFAKWTKRLSGFQVGLLHGKLRPEEKEEIMSRFRDGEIHALVSTSVIEVGVDVPNANLMIVHHAERFGLAQLHQLRGRIGRGGHKGYCVLLSDGKNPESMEKLGVMEKTSDGFEISEADLKLRGPGDVLGTAQSGIAEFRFSDFLTDTGLMREARARAAEILAEDPQLDGMHAAFREIVGRGAGPGAAPGTA